ncbi:DUF6069 family protein [Cellulosimicrobium marinum]|uniref:DUF6069 family protein n=1 Tax=Cellulosimicrobium marinum TaxID=1638992 RepID=UPI001E4758C4|nr:DUF6069 family protein [Cellulosimicrobium marinum]MCB7136122.1 DUF6069 family protein [Cellulosimicrobium marinum]
MSSQHPTTRPAPAASDRTGPAQDPSGRVTAARRRVPPWAVPLAAALVGAAVWLVGTAAGVDVAARSGSAVQDVGLVSVVVAALVVGFAGWGVRALLGRVRRAAPGRGERAWLVTCAVVLVVSLLGPLGGVGAGAVVVLLAEHVAVGAVVMLGLRRA